MSKHAISCPLRSYRDLIVWQKAIELVTEVYRATENLPHAERFGLSSQLRRAAVSVPSKVAEGQGRRSTGEFKQFLGHLADHCSRLKPKFSSLRISDTYPKNSARGCTS